MAFVGRATSLPLLKWHGVRELKAGSGSSSSSRGQGAEGKDRSGEMHFGKTLLNERLEAGTRKRYVCVV